MSSVLYCKNLSLNYGKHNIISQLSLEFNSTGLYTLLGSNGSGKSTFLKALLLDPNIKTSGEIHINSQVISHKTISQHIAFMPQFLQVPFAYSVLEIVMMGHKEYTYFLSDKQKITQKAKECLQELDILGLQDKNIQELSGGQRALVFIAKALCKDTPIILLDEPDSALDFSNRLLLFSYLEKIKSQKMVIISSHDPHSILKYSDYIIPIYQNSDYSPVVASNITVDLLKKIYPYLNDKNIQIQSIDGSLHIIL